MQQEREIVLFFNAEGKEKTLRSDIKTLGELKRLVKDYDLSNKKIMDQVTRAVFEADESIVPTGDFVLYIYPRKSKAGAMNYKKITVEKLGSLSYDQVREFGTYLKKQFNAELRLTGSKAAIIEQIRPWMISNSWPAATKPKAGKRSPEAEKLEGEFATQTGRAGVAATPRENTGITDVVESVREHAEEREPVSLETLNEKLNIIIEKLDKALGTTPTATPATRDLEEIRRDAQRMAGELHGVSSY